MSQDLFKIKVLNWNKHNPNRKSSYRYTLISNNFCTDSKLSVLPVSCRWMFLGVLLMCGSESSDTVVIAERHLRDLLESSKSVLSVLESLKLLQVLTFELVDLPLIKERKKERKKERNKNVGVPPTHASDLQPNYLAPPNNLAEPKKEADQELHWLAEMWNDLVPSLPKVKTTVGKRLEKIEARLRERPGRPEWESILRNVEASDYLTGRTGVWHACSFDWILGNDKHGTPNHVRVDEGVHNRSGKKIDKTISPEYQRPPGYYDAEEFTIKAYDEDSQEELDV